MAIVPIVSTEFHRDGAIIDSIPSRPDPVRSDDLTARRPRQNRARERGCVLCTVFRFGPEPERRSGAVKIALSDITWHGRRGRGHGMHFFMPLLFLFLEIRQHLFSLTTKATVGSAGLIYFYISHVLGCLVFLSSNQRTLSVWKWR